MNDKNVTKPSVGTTTILCHTKITSGWIAKGIDAQNNVVTSFWSQSQNTSLASGDKVGYLAEWKLQNDPSADPRKPKQVLRQVFELVPLNAIAAYNQAVNA